MAESSSSDSSSMGANEARFSFSNAQLDAETLKVVRFSGREAISQPFEFDLELVSLDMSVPFSDLVDQPATLTLDDGSGPYYVHGIVAHFEQGSASGDYVTYRAVLVPRIWRLTLSRRSRIFQDLSVPDIVKQVLQEAGLAPDDFRFDLNASYPEREYCVQYQETDLAFISRLLEYEGIQFFFEHDDSRETLVLTDDRSKNPPIEGDDRVIYQPMVGLAPSHEDTLQEFTFREQVVTGKVILKDYNDRTPEADLRAESQISGELPGTYYEHDALYPDASAGDRLAKVRNEEFESQRRIGTGQGTCMRLRAGHRFTLDQHYRLDLNHGYLITEIHHSGTQRDLVGMQVDGSDDDMPYSNVFTCIPSDAPYRPPRRTPEPRVPGIMTARMETAGGDYAHIDDQGRYRARMNFDLRDTGEVTEAEATLPVRMNQPYSGPGYGIHFPNHADTEMIWACVNGDPDRPLALGTVPNPSQESPSLQDNAFQNVIRTWGQNELTFDDKQGEENIYLHATKDHTVDVTNNESITIGNDQTESVGHDQSLSVGNDQAISVGNNRDKTVAKDQSEVVGGNKAIAVAGNHSETIGGNMTQTVGASKAENVAAAKSLAVGAAYQVSVGAAMNETVGGAKAEEVGAFKSESVGGNKSETVGGAKSVSVGQSLSIDIGDSQAVQIAKDFSCQIGGDCHEDIEKEWAVQAKKIQFVAKDEIVLKTGKAEIIMKKSGDITIKGKKIQVKGSGDVVIKGSKIKEN